jgi:hypothetical protein
MSMEYCSWTLRSSIVEMASRKPVTRLNSMTLPGPVSWMPSPTFLPFAPMASLVQGVTPSTTLSAT